MTDTLTSVNPAAIDVLKQGIHSFNRWRVDAMSYVDTALEHDPGFVMAHVVKGLTLLGGRNNRFMPIIEECVHQAQAGAAATTAVEQCYVQSMTALAAGEISKAVWLLEAMLQERPTDLFAHRLIQQELFWQGEVRWMRDVVVRARPAWSDSLPDYSYFLSVYAFSCEEAGDYEQAERAGREAVERDNSDYWGTHAVAHVLEMQSRNIEGAAWLEGLSGNWAEANQIGHHLWWHLCLFYLEQGEHEKILDLLDHKVRNPDAPLVQAVPDAYIDIQNVASMLLRLELRGVDVGERWLSIADVSAQRIDNHPSPFTSAHAVMALAACERFTEAEELTQTLRDYAANNQGTLSTRIKVAAVPAAEASIAHRRGDYEQVIKILMPARRDLWQMGGSHAQRDIFLQILFDACKRCHEQGHMSILLAEMAAIGFAKPTERTLYAS